jgi:tRNA threonylcarbamoyl adenosine modification protein YjeE
MGAGKSTFARELLKGLGVQTPFSGSPTFALAHEYTSPRGQSVHIDLYRLRSEDEIEQAGIESYFWERDVIVIAEWVSQFPDFERKLSQSPRGQIHQVFLDFTKDPERRMFKLQPDQASGKMGEGLPRGSSPRTKAKRPGPGSKPR